MAADDQDLLELVAVLEDGLPWGVGLVQGPEDEAPVLVVADRDELVQISLACDDTTLDVAIGFGGEHQLGCDATQAALILVVVAKRALGPGRSALALRTDDPIFRDQARRLGFTGPLRATLRRPAFESAGADVPERPPLEERIGTLLPAARVTRRVGSRLALSSRAVSSFVPDAVELDVTAPTGDEVRVLLSDGGDVMAESVAECVDTLLDVRRCFGPAADRLDRLTFAAAHRGFRRGRYSGLAELTISQIQLNAAWVTAGGVVRLRRQARSRPAPQRPARVAGGFTSLDGTVAHECWHLIESRFESARYADSIDFRRELGRYFGVGTLEHALQGGERGADPARRVAYERVRDEVSPYATTTIREATAEMFKLWWCTPVDPPPVVQAFGSAIERHFGVTR